MNTIFVITTKDLPVSNLNRYTIHRENPSLDDLVCSKIMSVPVNGGTNLITDYLTDYQHPRVNDSVLDFLSDCKSIPIFERTVGEFSLFIAPCISAQYSGGATAACHRYIANIVKFALKKMGQDSPIYVYVFAHDLDLIYKEDKGGNNRPLETGEDGECMGELSNLPTGHIWAFQHESGVRIYENIIQNLTKDDQELEKGCRTVLSLISNGTNC